MLCPLACPIEECPLNLLNYVEGVLIYFDANNVSYNSFILEFLKVTRLLTVTPNSTNFF